MTCQQGTATKGLDMETYIKKSELMAHLSETLERKRRMLNTFKEDGNDEMVQWYYGQIDAIKMIMNDVHSI